MHKEPKVREGASAALEAIANGSVHERKRLLEEDIIRRLIDHEERLEQSQINLLSSVIPKLAIDYLKAGKMGLILTLVEYHSWDTANFKPSKSYSTQLKVSNNISNIENLFENFTF
jgi:hypothetical protein